jgi:hypothetical protein
MNHRTTRKTSICLALAVCLIGTGLRCEGVSAASVADLVEQVSRDSYMNYLQNNLFAHDGDDRCYGPAHDLARQNIQERFEGFGLSTSLDGGVWRGTAYPTAHSNVVGVHPGVICPDEIYIFGAHYDSVARSPGAWDNASGVAVVLEAARILSQYTFEQTIVFIAFDREEQGMIGSFAYAEKHTQDHIRGMISADSIAYRPYQPEDPNYNKVSLFYIYDQSRATKLFSDLEGALGSYAGLTCVIGQQNPSFGSDNEPFETGGFAAAWLMSYAWSPFYHTPLDSVDTPAYIDYEYAAKATRGVVGYLATQARLAPVRVSPDLNGDWKVDIEDLTLLIEHWGQDDPLFDIAPPPLGDGTVDVQDLEGLMHYWGQEIPEPGLVARWKLDEEVGDIAADSVGTNNGVLFGNPLWQPAGGKLGGALQLDGIDDCVTTKFVCNPSLGPFSVFAWIKGGAPGQVIVSQTAGVDWLSAGSIEGKLMTRLSRPAGRVAPGPLTSPSVVTDGNWHRVGFVWDGSNRILYVDGVEVARDTQTGLGASGGGLHIGAGSTLAPGTFWSGLIDDVRIYNRAVKP